MRRRFGPIASVKKPCRPPPLSAAEVRALQMPYPYFGGKAPIAAVVWERLGAVRHYVEPLCGTAAVLLGCRTPAAVETVNDVDGLLVNVLRALKADPTGVASYAADYVSELDLHARHRWLVDQVPTLTAQLEADPQFYDVQAAGGGSGANRVGSAPAGARLAPMAPCRASSQPCRIPDPAYTGWHGGRTPPRWGTRLRNCSAAYAGCASAVATGSAS